MNNIERAAEVIGREYGPCNDDVNHRGTEAHDAAEALADAGLLLTDADRAVLDAADEWLIGATVEEVALAAAVRARRETA